MKKSFLDEFKEFAIRGNMVDMAVGIIVGAAFGKLINSFVVNMVMPPLGWLTGRINLSDYFINLSGGHYTTLKDAQAAGAVTVNYGLVLDDILTFIIVAVVVFLFIKQINRLKRVEPPPPATPTQKPCPYCYSNIPIKAVRCPECTSQLEVKPTTVSV